MPDLDQPGLTCAECGAFNPDPIEARCISCESRQLRRVDPIEEAIRDALAHAENALAANELDRERLLAIITKLTFALGSVS